MHAPAVETIDDYLAPIVLSSYILVTLHPSFMVRVRFDIRLLMKIATGIVSSDGRFSCDTPSTPL